MLPLQAPTSPRRTPSSLQVEWAAGREVTQALLDLFLEAEEDATAAAALGGPPATAFSHLLSLHAFAVADVALCMPSKDPACFVRSLAPYLKVGAGERAPASRQPHWGPDGHQAHVMPTPASSWPATAQRR